MDPSQFPFDDDGVWHPPHGRKTRWIARLILLMIAAGLVTMLLIIAASIF